MFNGCFKLELHLGPIRAFFLSMFARKAILSQGQVAIEVPPSHLVGALAGGSVVVVVAMVIVRPVAAQSQANSVARPIAAVVATVASVSVVVHVRVVRVVDWPMVVVEVLGRAGQRESRDYKSEKS